MSASLDVSAAVPKPVRLRGGPVGVVLFHGLSSSPLELQFLARGLQRAGYTVHLPVIEGYTFGMDTEPHRRVDHWLAQARAEVLALRQQCDTVIVGGLCVGSTLALCVAAQLPADVAAVMVLSVSMHYDGWGNPWITRLLPLARVVPFAGRIRVPERPPFGLKDERMRAWIATQMQRMGRSEAGAASLRVADLLRARDLVARVRTACPQLQVPLLLVHAKEDECSTPRGAVDIARAVNSTQVRLVLMADCYHMISIDREKELVLGEMLQFLQHHVQQEAPDATTRSGRVVSLFGSTQGKTS